MINFKSIILLFVLSTRFVSSIPTKTRPEDFDVLCQLGKGGFATVYKACKNQDPNRGTCIAVKCMEKSWLLSKNMTSRVRKEASIPLRIDHPNVVKLLYTFQSKTHIFLGLELVNGGDLQHHLKKVGYFKEKTAQFYLTEIVLALEHLHDNDIIHRDVKPGNVLLDASGHAKLADFGLCRKLKKGEKAFSCCGTFGFMAPEIMKHFGYDKTVDWHSLGATMYNMVFGEVDPGKRLGYNGAEEVKSCPYLKKVNWEDVKNLQMTPPLIPEILEDENELVNLVDVISQSTKSTISDVQQELFRDFSSRLKLSENSVDKLILT